MNIENSFNPESGKVKFEKMGGAERIEEIEKAIKDKKISQIEAGGEQFKIEYIDVPAFEQNSEKKRVILLIPGFSTSVQSFEGTVEELASYVGDKEVICISPPDSGGSSSVEGLDLEKMRKILEGFLKDLNLDKDSEITLIGHSRSDLYAMDFAKAHPELVKNLVIANGIAANEKSFLKLMKDFIGNVGIKQTVERLKNYFDGDEEVAENYLNVCRDFVSNMANPKRLKNQLSATKEAHKTNFREIMLEIKSNTLVITGTEDITDVYDTREKILNKLPENVNKQLRIEAGGMHDEIYTHPEAFALKIKSWLKSIENN